MNTIMERIVKLEKRFEKTNETFFKRIIKKIFLKNKNYHKIETKKLIILILSNEF